MAGKDQKHWKGDLMSVRTLNDLLEIAIGHEISSQKFYRDALKNTDDPEVQYFLKKLIEEEVGHEKLLRSIVEMKIYDGGVKVDSKAAEAAGHSHDTDIQELTAEPSLDEVYEIALKRETMAINLFTRMAKTTDEPELRTLFTRLAEEEQMHHKNIDRKYQINRGEMGFEG
jgi:rubrerythrin